MVHTCHAFHVLPSFVFLVFGQSLSPNCLCYHYPTTTRWQCHHSFSHMCLSRPRVVWICVYHLPPAHLVSVLCWFLHPPTCCSVCLFVFWPFLLPRLEVEVTTQYVFHVNNPVVLNLFLGNITQALLSHWSNLTTILPTSQHDLMAYLNRPLKKKVTRCLCRTIL